MSNKSNSGNFPTNLDPRNEPPEGEKCSEMKLITEHKIERGFWLKTRTHSVPKMLLGWRVPHVREAALSLRDLSQPVDITTLKSDQWKRI